MVVPVFGDQPSNALEAERRGYGIAIPLPELTEDKLFNAIKEILDNPSYARRAQEHGTMLMDEMTKPLDRAVWWIEYALRYPGMKHMRSPVHDLHWTQYFLLDVIGFIALVVTIVLFIVVKTLSCCCRMCFGKSGKKVKTN